MTRIVKCDNVWKSFSRRSIGIKELFLGKKPLSTGRYSREWALQAVSFDIARGQSVGVIGHNGTGKSTLLSLLLGTILPDKGNIEVKGRIASLLELGAGFHPELTGRENVLLYGTILGMSLREVRLVFDRIVEFSELGPAIEQPLRTYSNGMITRLGFSTIIHAPADILLIDEVLAVGDSRFQQKCLERLKQFHQDNGTLIIVSHSMQSLSEMCDVGICLDMGQVVSSGKIDDVIQYYQSAIYNDIQNNQQANG